MRRSVTQLGQGVLSTWRASHAPRGNRQNQAAGGGSVAAQANVPETVTRELLEPLEQLARDPDLLSGSHWGRAIFRSPDAFRQFAVTEFAKPRLHVGGCFEIRPILMELHSPAEFFLVRHSKKGVEVFRSAGLRAESIQFSEGVPRTLEEALAFKAPDHDLETRAASGSSARAMRGVRQLLGAASEAPLVPAGVDEDTVRYRMINRYPKSAGPQYSRQPELLSGNGYVGTSLCDCAVRLRGTRGPRVAGFPRSAWHPRDSPRVEQHPARRGGKGAWRASISIQPPGCLEFSKQFAEPDPAAGARKIS